MRAIQVWFLVLVCAAVALHAGCGRSAPLRGLEQFPETREVYVSVHPYDVQESAPIEITARVAPYLEEEGGLSSCKIDWGDGSGWEPVLSRDPTHWYLLNGDYTISVRQLVDNGYLSLSACVDIRIGPKERDYVDPETGMTIRILDGRVMVGFIDWERLVSTGCAIADDPEVAAFVVKENLRVYTEWKSIGVIMVILPDETTVEEAIDEWPGRYPELIDGVEPDALSEIA